MIKNWKENIEKLKIEIYTLYLAYNDPRVPLRVKILMVLVITYLISPIDLIPDFIPVLGYLDDIFLITVGIPLILKMIPKEILDEHRKTVKLKFKEGIPENKYAAILIIFIWLLVAYLIIKFIFKFI